MPDASSQEASTDADSQEQAKELYKELMRKSGVSGKELRDLASKNGWTVEGQEGSHIICKRGNAKRPLVIPNHRELKKGTKRGILKKLLGLK